MANVHTEHVLFDVRNRRSAFAYATQKVMLMPFDRFAVIERGKIVVRQFRRNPVVDRLARNTRAIDVNFTRPPRR